MRDVLLRRLQVIAPDDPLWDALLWLVRSNLHTELDSISAVEMSDGTAHRSRGRISAFRDIEDQLKEARERAMQGSI